MHKKTKKLKHNTVDKCDKIQKMLTHTIQKKGMRGGDGCFFHTNSQNIAVKKEYCINFQKRLKKVSLRSNIIFVHSIFLTKKAQHTQKQKTREKHTQGGVIVEKCVFFIPFFNA